MTCRRICRELLWQARFGELGPGSAPHLQHLSECRSCRDELGFDRALVRQLRTALAARIEGAAPSPQAWDGVLARMAQAEPRPSRLRVWSTALVAKLRFGSAMAGATLAVLMAVNVQIVPVRPAGGAGTDAGGIPAGEPARPITLADGFAQSALANPYGSDPESRAALELRRPVQVGDVPQPEQLPLNLSAQPADTPTSEPATEPEPPPAETWQPLTVRLVPSDAAVIRAASDEEAEPAPADVPEPAPPVSSAPS